MAVPVLRKRFSADTPVEVGDSFWDVESWIAPPATSEVPLVMWNKNIKISRTHALFYYTLASISPTEANSASHSAVWRQEAIGDILLLKLQGGEAINVGEEEAQEMLGRLPSLLY
jgi:hypothetical protein